ncbi:DUF294 nucleotidyltransferase-like domain-containing protein [Sulfoacidibacillus thermotolerans]|uniref:CBS domain-containing protein n=1 Tax=Sulfoacidibacillus thermotolerans TaxID=1765684 RepID=A0A2U3D7A4_SULT2|nr:DUF294 nucleotidyltransferase-like domain-containing protein [Sulfoacidibacillus thermotolerans]PWI57157.1 hypothetical protein BM613_09805 [Sulfoacidibacillus thermotolerans]
MLTFEDEKIYSLHALRAFQQKLPHQIDRSLHADSVEQTYHILSQHHRMMHRQAFLLAQKQLQREGLDPPCAAFCFIMLGSGARSEQALRVDQDHALIFAPCRKEEEQSLQTYFFQLSELVSAYLHEIGYTLCTGNVMASNPRWRGTVEDWSLRLTRYQQEPTWEHIRFLLIAADAVPILGEEALVFMMRQQVVDYFARSSFVRWKIADQGRADKIPLPLWRKGVFSLKEALYSPLVNSIRLWAHSIDVAEPSTLRRIERLHESHCWNGELAHEAQQVVRKILNWRVRLHVDQLLRGVKATDLLQLEELTAGEWEQIKTAVRFVRKLQSLTAKRFHERGNTDGI